MTDIIEVSARGRDYIERAVAEAKRRNPTVNVSVFDFARDTLLLQYAPWANEAGRAERRHFVMRFQQDTGPVTAKRVEDTEKNAQRLARFPVALLESEPGS